MSDWQWQIATVHSLKNGRLALFFDPPESCRRCAEGQGCGAGVYSRLFVRRHAVLPVPAQYEWLQVGSRVRVGVPARVLMLMALRLYGLPLTAFVVGAAAGHHLIPATVWQDLISLGLGLGAALASWSWLSRRPPIGGNPRIEPLSCTEPAAALESRS